MARCKACNQSSSLISRTLGICGPCIRKQPEFALQVAAETHRRSRLMEGLPASAPDDPQGVSCGLCVNECRIPVGRFGYCGLRKNESGRLAGISERLGKLTWYHDPLPTNCVADWVCAGGTGAGHPRFAHCNGPQYGSYNLAVFFLACSFNCLFCQNRHFANEAARRPEVPVRKLADDVGKHTSCICYFGGDPSVQLPFSLAASRMARQRNPDQILRVCWETNGSMAPRLLDRMVNVALDSGGCVKFDIKSWDETLHVVLTGVTNRRTLSNFRRVGKMIQRRLQPPPLIASTLLVPGYVDSAEVRAIAEFIASVRADIPYRLLAFHPAHLMSDMPPTSRQQADECMAAARSAGLTRVSLGNQHLLM